MFLDACNRCANRRVKQGDLYGARGARRSERHAASGRVLRRERGDTETEGGGDRERERAAIEGDGYGGDGRGVGDGMITISWTRIRRMDPRVAAEISATRLNPRLHGASLGVVAKKPRSGDEKIGARIDFAANISGGKTLFAASPLKPAGQKQQKSLKSRTNTGN